MFNEAYLGQLIPELEAQGVTFGPGLTDKEVENIERTCAFIFPADLRTFLQYALPLEHREPPHYSQKFPDWRGDLSEILDYIEMKMLGITAHQREVYVRQGEKPDDIEKAVRQLRDQIKQAPRLIPVYSHRFMPALPEAGNPVYSVMDLDTVYYGFDLARYFANEFGVTCPDGTAKTPRKVEFWHEFVASTTGYTEGMSEMRLF